LRHGTSQLAQGAFDFAQVADFFAECHISNRYVYIAICNVLSRNGSGVFSEVCSRDSWKLRSLLGPLAAAWDREHANCDH
jgi:hypothetical protein